MFKEKKRFIAGAVCPRCGEMDSLMTWNNESNEVYRSCVLCNFEDQLSDLLPPELSEPKTRVSEGSFEKVVLDEDEKALTILPSPNSKTK